MGLDMYLTAKIYLSDYANSDKEQKAKDFLNDLKFSDKINLNFRYIEAEIGYWRKANQIHSWFVENCGDGVDDCRPYFVSQDKLEDLLKIINNILEEKNLEKQHKLIGEHLEPKSGFFFGSLNIDEFYFDDLKYTKDLIEKIFEDPFFENAYIYYHASW